MNALVGDAADGWTPLWADSAEEPTPDGDSGEGPAWPLPALMVNAWTWPRLRLVVGADEALVAVHTWEPPALRTGSANGTAEATEFVEATATVLSPNGDLHAITSGLMDAPTQVDVVKLLGESFALPNLWPDAARTGWRPIGEPDRDAQLRPEAWGGIDPLASPHGW
jgi:hypothetical protein